MPRKPHEPTEKNRAEVSALVSFGVPYIEIAKYIGIDVKTLQKWYKEELSKANIKASATVAKFAYRLASGQAIHEGATFGDCSRMTMFWLKTRCGWREKDRIEDQQQEAPPVKVEFTVKDARVDTSSTEPTSE